MTNNYFAIERTGRCVETLIVGEDGAILFEDLMKMSYEEMKAYDNIEGFVVTVMDMVNTYFEENDEPTTITLVGEDNVFIWGILIGPEDKDGLKYAFIDWKKDGKSYRYEKK